jgi:hypothetical protein
VSCIENMSIFKFSSISDLVECYGSAFMLMSALVKRWIIIKMSAFLLTSKIWPYAVVITSQETVQNFGYVAVVV